MSTPLIVVIALLAGAMLGPVSAAADTGKDCVAARTARCEAFKRPQPRVTRPLPCVPVKFDQYGRATVVLEIQHGTRGIRRLSGEFNEAGQRCVGAQWLHGASRVTICNGDRTFVWNPQMVADGLAKGELRGTLKGTQWYASHRADYD